MTDDRNLEDAAQPVLDAVQAGGPSSELEMLLSAWGLTWGKVKERMDLVASRHPDIAPSINEIMFELELLLTRDKYYTMLAKAGSLVYEALSSGRSETTNDPSAMA